MDLIGKRKEYPVELKQLLERASTGDASAMPPLSAEFDSHPELVEMLGDLAKVAETALLNLATKSNLVVREAIMRQLVALREKLNASTGTELERLLVTRISLDWLSLQHATIELAGHLELSGTGANAKAAERRLDRAHARFLSSTKTLATVGRLLRRAPSPLDLLRIQTDAQTPSPSKGRSGRRFEVPVAAN